jgi:hypothetical protein
VLPIFPYTGNGTFRDGRVQIPIYSVTWLPHCTRLYPSLERSANSLKRGGNRILIRANLMLRCPFGESDVAKRSFETVGVFRYCRRFSVPCEDDADLLESRNGLSQVEEPIRDYYAAMVATPG